MDFLQLALSQCEGCLLAHTAGHGKDIVKKGTLLTPTHLEKLRGLGYEAAVVARLAPGDVLENEAAGILAQRLRGAHVTPQPSFTGRANLHADVAGLLRIDRTVIDQFNACDEAVTLAVLNDFSPVSLGEMVATVKIIPFAISAELLSAASAAGAAAISVVPFKPKRIAVISTLLPHLKAATVSKTLRVLESRLGASQSVIVDDIRVPHDLSALSDAIVALDPSQYDLLVIFGASAVTDRRDVVPEAVVRAGGEIMHVGMPVDPGNLLVLGSVAGRTVIGAPGCARSPRENGFDWILNRLLADIVVSREDIMRMGVGGLLKEIGTRPQPRSGDDNP